MVRWQSFVPMVSFWKRENTRKKSCYLYTSLNALCWHADCRRRYKVRERFPSKGKISFWETKNIRYTDVEKSKGVIKFFNSQKGFGFITPESGGKELFVHISNVKGDATALKEGTRVSYVEGAGRKGPEATDVAIL